MSQCPKCGLQMGLHGSILPGCMCFPDTLVFKGHQLPSDDTALLRQALDALEAGDWYIDQLEMIVYSADDTGTNGERAKVQAAIADLRERLGDKA